MTQTHACISIILSVTCTELLITVTVLNVIFKPYISVYLVPTIHKKYSTTNTRHELVKFIVKFVNDCAVYSTSHSLDLILNHCASN